MPTRPETWDGPQKALLFGHEILQVFVELHDLLDEEVDALHDEANLQGQVPTAMSEREGGFSGGLQGLCLASSEGSPADQGAPRGAVEKALGEGEVAIQLHQHAVQSAAHRHESSVCPLIEDAAFAQQLILFR